MPIKDVVKRSAYQKLYGQERRKQDKANGVKPVRPKKPLTGRIRIGAVTQMASGAFRVDVIHWGCVKTFGVRYNSENFSVQMPPWNDFDKRSTQIVNGVATAVALKIIDAIQDQLGITLPRPASKARADTDTYP
jgi:hypothetical protein